MQVSVEEVGTLERRMTVQVPAERIDPEVKNRLTSLCRKVRLDGFRPGKVPYKVVKRMYGPQVRQEVMSEVLQDSYREALTQQNLKPLNQPSIEPKNLNEGEDLEYSATFEVFPEFEVKGLDDLQVERPQAEVTETDVDNMIETLRKQRTVWNEVDRPAREGDQVTLDFEGKLDGEDFPHNKGEDAKTVIGSGGMIKEFEEKLIGLQKGTETEFQVTFPEDYHGQEVAGKTVDFKIKIKSVAEPVLPELNEEFAAAFDVHEDGIEGLRQAVRENMERELQKGIKRTVKNRVMERLLEANDVPLPQTMVKEQIESMARQMGVSVQDEGDEKVAELKAELFGSEARRRVAMSLIVSRLAADQGIKVDEAKVRSQLVSLAADYEDPQAVVQWYSQNPQAMESVHAAVLEEEALDWLLERAQITDKPSSFDEVVKPHQHHETGAPQE